MRMGEPGRGRSERRPEASSGAPHIKLDLTEQSGAATGSAMAHVLARPDSIRQRAQNAATISSALAAAVAIASIGLLTETEAEDFRFWTKAAVVLALVLWAAAVWRYIHVVTLGPERDTPPNATYRDIVEAYEDYSDHLRRNLRRASHVAGAALFATVVAVSMEIIERTSSKERGRELVLAPDTMAALAMACRWTDWSAGDDRRVRVSVSSDELGKEVIELVVRRRVVVPKDARRRCGAPTPEIRLPRDGVLLAGDVRR